jgi:hypothetical protein
MARFQSLSRSKRIFHTEALHVVERITRIGDSLRWEATAEDPNVLAKPWVMTHNTRPSPKA